MHHLRPPVFFQVDLSVDLDSRIGIIGRNGCGKTTLIKVCFLITVGPI
jgi:ATPase subunit of ABC transporter with duplicated ATPase domains